MPGPSDPGPGLPHDPLAARIYGGALLAGAVVSFLISVALILKGY